RPGGARGGAAGAGRRRFHRSAGRAAARGRHRQAGRHQAGDRHGPRPRRPIAQLRLCAGRAARARSPAGGGRSPGLGLFARARARRAGDRRARADHRRADRDARAEAAADGGPFVRRRGVAGIGARAARTGARAR
nr:hypothetical protein [Tanacetum cinerariifolium]